LPVVGSTRSLCAALFACCLAACGDGRLLGAAERQFEGERAFRDLRHQVELGPRPSGSRGAAATRDWLRKELGEAGWNVREQRFQGIAPGGIPVVDMVNLIAERPGREDRAIVFGTHYDTKRMERRFVGANDGASGTAVLVELARALGPAPSRYTIRLLFFDGEEAFGEYITPQDGLYGSKALADEMLRSGELQNTRALINIDMIGDKDLNIGVDMNSDPELRELLIREGAELVDLDQTLRLVDDHMPFKDKGLESVLGIIDFAYGSRSTPGPIWHTPADDLPAVSADSLNSVGRLLIRMLGRLEADGSHADADPGVRAPRSDGMLEGDGAELKDFSARPDPALGILLPDEPSGGLRLAEHGGASEGPGASRESERWSGQGIGDLARSARSGGVRGEDRVVSWNGPAARGTMNGPSGFRNPN
jgi:glutaminyl-peptide cyclotransferase